MAGTASTAPAIRPLSESWRSFSKLDLHFDQLPVLHLCGAERDLDDVAYVGELAGARSARIFDFLAVADRLQPVERVVDLHRLIVVCDLADVVLDPGAARVLALCHGEDREV